MKTPSITNHSPSLRSLLCAMFVLLCPALVLAGGAQAPGDDARYQAMIELAWKSRCFNCHDVHGKVRGPAWSEVARRYRGDDTAFEGLVTKVREGGSGNWGDDYMSANRRVPEEDIRTLVGWLLTLE